MARFTLTELQLPGGKGPAGTRCAQQSCGLVCTLTNNSASLTQPREPTHDPSGPGTRHRSTSLDAGIATGEPQRKLPLRALNDVLPSAQERLPELDRKLAQEICYGVCRWYTRLDKLLAQLLEHPLKARDEDKCAAADRALPALLHAHSRSCGHQRNRRGGTPARQNLGGQTGQWRIDGAPSARNRRWNSSCPPAKR